MEKKRKKERTGYLHTYTCISPSYIDDFTETKTFSLNQNLSIFCTETKDVNYKRVNCKIKLTSKKESYTTMNLH